MGKTAMAGAFALGLMATWIVLAGEPRTASACSCGCADERVDVELESVDVDQVRETDFAAYEGAAVIGLGFDGNVFFVASTGEGVVHEAQSQINFDRR